MPRGAADLSVRGVTRVARHVVTQVEQLFADADLVDVGVFETAVVGG